MFRLAMDIGLSMSEYNDTTPYELGIMAESYNKRTEYQLYLSWLNANLSNAKKIPKFSELTSKKKSQKSNTESSRTRMADYEIDIHLSEFKKERRLLLIG